MVKARVTVEVKRDATRPNRKRPKATWVTPTNIVVDAKTTTAEEEEEEEEKATESAVKLKINGEKSFQNAWFVFLFFFSYFVVIM